jgi:hypothetical protein
VQHAPRNVVEWYSFAWEFVSTFCPRKTVDLLNSLHNSDRISTLGSPKYLKLVPLESRLDKLSKMSSWTFITFVNQKLWLFLSKVWLAIHVTFSYVRLSFHVTFLMEVFCSTVL